MASCGGRGYEFEVPGELGGGGGTGFSDLPHLILGQRQELETPL